MDAVAYGLHDVTYTAVNTVTISNKCYSPAASQPASQSARRYFRLLPRSCSWSDDFANWRNTYSHLMRIVITARAQDAMHHDWRRSSCALNERWWKIFLPLLVVLISCTVQSITFWFQHILPTPFSTLLCVCHTALHLYRIISSRSRLPVNKVNIKKWGKVPYVKQWNENSLTLREI